MGASTRRWRPDRECGVEARNALRAEFEQREGGEGKEDKEKEGEGLKAYASRRLGLLSHRLRARKNVARDERTPIDQRQLDIAVVALRDGHTNGAQRFALKIRRHQVATILICLQPYFDIVIYVHVSLLLGRCAEARVARSCKDYLVLEDISYAACTRLCEAGT